MDACCRELTITPSVLQSSQFKVAEVGGALVGVAQVVIKPKFCQLDKLFVEPVQIGSGIGRALYRRMGVIEVGATQSGSIPGRCIPRLRVDL
jgi:hypothetical protein